MTEDLSAGWRRVEQRLAVACEGLGVPAEDISLREYSAFIDANELELAWAEVVALAREVEARHEVWLALAEAATVMGLDEDCVTPEALALVRSHVPESDEG